MIIDKQGRLFSKISIIDLIIIIVIIAGIAGFFLKYQANNAVTPFTRADMIEIIFTADEMRADAVDNDMIKVGDPVRERATGTYFGTVTKIEKFPARTFGIDDKGESVLTSKPDTYFVRIYVEGEGSFSGNGPVTYGVNEFYASALPEVRVGKVTQYMRIEDYRVIG